MICPGSYKETCIQHLITPIHNLIALGNALHVQLTPSYPFQCIPIDYLPYPLYFGKKGAPFRGFTSFACSFPVTNQGVIQRQSYYPDLMFSSIFLVLLHFLPNKACLLFSASPLHCVCSFFPQMVLF